MTFYLQKPREISRYVSYCAEEKKNVPTQIESPPAFLNTTDQCYEGMHQKN